MKQAESILKALKEAGDKGIHPTYIIVNLHIYQYNARIFELRELFGCTHKNGNSCSAKEHIINKTLEDGTTIFVYRNYDVENSERMKKYMQEYQDEKVVELDQQTLF